MFKNLFYKLIRFYWHTFVFLKSMTRSSKFIRDYVAHADRYLAKYTPPDHWADGLIVIINCVAEDGTVKVIGVPILTHASQNGKLFYTYSFDAKEFLFPFASVAELSADVRNRYDAQLSLGWVLIDTKLRLLQYSWK
jgi:hypothetical protein